MIGVEMVGSAGEPAVDLANAVAKRGMDHGLIIRTSRYGFGNVFKIRPPLTMTLQEAELMCDRLDALLTEVLS